MDRNCVGKHKRKRSVLLYDRIVLNLVITENNVFPYNYIVQCFETVDYDILFATACVSYSSSRGCVYYCIIIC